MKGYAKMEIKHDRFILSEKCLKKFIASRNIVLNKVVTKSWIKMKLSSE